MATHVNQLSKGAVQVGDISIDGATMPRVSTFDIDNTTGGGGSGSWSNPSGAAAIVLAVGVNVTTTSGASGALDIGTAASTTTTSDNLIDGVNVAAATGWKTSITDPGTNGTGLATLAATGAVTCTISAGTAGSLAGTAYVVWMPTPT